MSKFAKVSAQRYRIAGCEGPTLVFPSATGAPGACRLPLDLIHSLGGRMTLDLIHSIWFVFLFFPSNLEVS